jgi:hypothetical protein
LSLLYSVQEVVQVLNMTSKTYISLPFPHPLSAPGGSLHSIKCYILSTLAKIVTSSRSSSYLS